jgi:hypothetical protein
MSHEQGRNNMPTLPSPPDISPPPPAPYFRAPLPAPCWPVIDAWEAAHGVPPWPAPLP